MGHLPLSFGCVEENIGEKKIWKEWTKGSNYNVEHEQLSFTLSLFFFFFAPAWAWPSQSPIPTSQSSLLREIGFKGKNHWEARRVVSFLFETIWLWVSV